MKNLKKLIALCLTLILCMSMPLSVSAAVQEPEPAVPNYLIDENAAGSLTIYKFDWTNLLKDGVWDEDSFTSTGWQESYVEEVLGNTVREGDANDAVDHPLGNGETSNSYALKGVEFTILRVADIVTFTEAANDQHPDYNLTQVLYGFDKTKAAPLLSTIGLADGTGRYENADSTDKLDASKYYYTSDTLNKALADSLAENSTTVKNALEAYVAASDEKIVMDKTNEYGKTKAENLAVGLWLVTESAVPEAVTSTTNNFFVSIPMTTVSGDENSASPEGGHQWNYDIVVYPKNETGIPTLTKEVREAQADGGNHDGTDAINDGFAHTATGSTGDTKEYQILSTLPTITSQASRLTAYNFYDTISEGLTYDKDLNNVKIEFFTDKGCTDKIATWDMDSGKFTVEYSGDGRHMTVNISDSGLADINGSTENANGKLYAGYSNYTARVTYTCTLNANATTVHGDSGNRNEVVLTWKRTSSEYYDTLIDDTHVYSFGINITKLFSDVDPETATQTGMYEHVKFKIYTTSDNQWLTAAMNEEAGGYPVTGHVAEEANATIFTPVTMGEQLGQIYLLGCENDEFVIREIETADGYTLLKDDIHVVLSVAEDADRVCDIYSKDIVGALQNDPHYSFDGGLDLKLANIPQTQLAHTHLGATATVDGNEITMTAENGSSNAVAPLTVKNTAGFDLPQTGDNGTWIYSMAGILLMAGAVAILLLTFKRKSYTDR